MLNIDWMEDALCREIGSEIFFPEDSDAHAAKRATKICLNCPVIEECLDYALTMPVLHGVLGGMTAQERARFKRRRRTA